MSDMNNKKSSKKRCYSPYSVSGEIQLHGRCDNLTTNNFSGIATDVSWLRKALKRAKEQAADENKSLEEIAAMRWGSLEKFYSLLEEAERKSGSKYFPQGNYGISRDFENCKDRRNTSGEGSSSRRNNDNISMRNKMMRPMPDDECNSFSKSQIKPVSSSMQKCWRKKKDISEENTVQEKIPSILPPEDNTVVERKETIPTRIPTDQELNKLAAKLTKAELVGNNELAEKLRQKLTAFRQASTTADICKKTEKRAVEEVILTRTMPSGYTVPVSVIESKPLKRKTKLASFLEESRDLKQMFQHEKETSAEDQNEVSEATSLQIGHTIEDEYDDMGGTADALNKQYDRLQDKRRQRTILEHHNNEKSVELCTWCIMSKEMQRHLIVSLGTKCYVALLPHEELANGQCVISPIHHVQSSLLADEDLWEEIMDFRKALVNFYQSRDEDCVFFETYLRNKSRVPHMVIHCIPLPKETGDLSPIYFKKAIDECEHEWAQNKKLVDLKGKGLRRCLPKGLSYFFVDFGCCPGYAHVIEDERSFPKKFGEEIVGGMLDAEAFLWLRPPKQSFDKQCKKVMEFTENFKQFDPINK